MGEIHHLRTFAKDEAIAIAKVSFHQALTYVPDNDYRSARHFVALHQLGRYIDAAEAL